MSNVVQLSKLRIFPTRVSSSYNLEFPVINKKIWSVKENLVMKKLFALMLALAMVLSLAACSDSKTDAPEETPSNTETNEPSDSLTIGLSMYTLEYPFYVTMCDAFEAACEERGWTCITTNASTDATTQLNDCLDLLNKDIDALVLTSWYGDALSEAFVQANEMGIPIFLMDTSTLPDEGEFVTRIGTVNYDAGYVGGFYAGKYLVDSGKTSVDTVALHSGDEVSTDRRDGILAGLADAGLTVNMLNEYHSASREDSMANFEDAMTTYSNIDLVVATSAQHGMGAYSAAEAAGRNEMLIVAYDGEAEEMDAIDNGTDTYLCTVTQDPAGMSQTIAQEINDYMFNGASYEQFQSAPAGVYGKDGQLSAADLGIG